MRAWAEREASDWDEVGRLAKAARVAPLLYRAWRDERFAPVRLQRAVRRAYLQTARRNVALLRELATAVAALDVAGLPSIVLKGAALAESVYGNVALRPMVDVDLLVRREDLHAALTVLAGGGFTAATREPRVGAAAAFENELLLLKPGPLPVALEIHWSLFDSPYYQRHLHLDRCWAAARPLRLGTTEARMLDPISQLLHLCGHLVLHHGGTDLLWEHDIAECIAVYGAELDWSALLDRAAEWKLIVAIQSLLPRLAEEAGAPIPVAVIERVRALRPTREEQRIAGYLSARERGVTRRFWNDLSSMNAWTDRVRYAWTHLFPSPAYMRERYGFRSPLLLPLYYSYRWLRGLGDR